MDDHDPSPNFLQPIRHRQRVVHASRRGRAALMTAVTLVGAIAAVSLPASAQSFRGSCARFDRSLVAADPGQAYLVGQSAQRLMNEIAKQTASGAQPVAGAVIFKGEGQVVILWIRGEYICNNGPYDRAAYDRAERAVFGIEA